MRSIVFIIRGEATHYFFTIHYYLLLSKNPATKLYLVKSEEWKGNK